jgi:hypothetical protein
MVPAKVAIPSADTAATCCRSHSAGDGAARTSQWAPRPATAKTAPPMAWLGWPS